MKPLRITALVDWNATPDADREFRSETPPPETEYQIIQALRQMGHTVEVVPFTADIPGVLHALSEQAPEIIVNLTEELGGDRRHDRDIAAVLELTRIPYTGSGPLGLALCRDKALSKRLLKAHRIRVPGFHTFHAGEHIRVPRAFPFPAVVKPLYGDGSDGISNASVVPDAERMGQRVAFICERFGPAIVEAYIEGQELYVSVLGNRRLRVLPAREVVFGNTSPDGPMISTHSVKFNAAYRKKWGIEFRPAALDPALATRIASVCRRAYRALQLRDYARVDLRIAPQGQIVVLEVNPNPDLAYGEEVAEAAEAAGLDYPALLTQVLRSALRRFARPQD